MWDKGDRNLAPFSVCLGNIQVDGSLCFNFSNIFMMIMPRKQRGRSNTEYCYIMTRGNEPKNILVDDENKIYFIEKLKEE